MQQFGLSSGPKANKGRQYEDGGGRGMPTGACGVRVVFDERFEGQLRGEPIDCVNIYLKLSLPFSFPSPLSSKSTHTRTHIAGCISLAFL